MPPRIRISDCDVGRGVFAEEPIVAGTEILRFTGPLLTLNQVRSRGDLAANALQIGIDRYLYLDEPGRLINHSCSPNVGVRDDVHVIALRNIPAGEEIRFDYSTTVSDGWTMACRCGTSDCRGLVVAFQLLPESLRQRYAVQRLVQRFILEAVEA
jgi:SET domain-containing protein